MSALFLVGTPIGNLQDITLRALQTLKEVPLIAAEDTRVTHRLLTHHQIQTRLTSYHEHSKPDQLATLLAHLENQDLALVSDAGMPGLSDPGYELVRAAVQRGHRVIPIPGPSAGVTALVASGLPGNEYLYLGFLPRRPAARQRLLESVSGERRTLIAFESPHRLLNTLKNIQETLGEQRPLVVARELTKLHEEIRRGTAGELVAYYSDRPPRGEITLVIAGRPEEKESIWDDARVLAAVREFLAAGESPASAAKEIARLSGRPRREVYQLAVNAGEKA